MPLMHSALGAMNKHTVTPNAVRLGLGLVLYMFAEVIVNITYRKTPEEQRAERAASRS